MASLMCAGSCSTSDDKTRVLFYPGLDFVCVCAYGAFWNQLDFSVAVKFSMLVCVINLAVAPYLQNTYNVYTAIHVRCAQDMRCIKSICFTCPNTNQVNVSWSVIYRRSCTRRNAQSTGAIMAPELQLSVNRSPTARCAEHGCHHVS